MTVEMGPRDGEVSQRHQLAGYSVKGAVALMNAVSDDAYGRYDRVKGVVSLYGQSEDAGDEFVRGRHVSAVTSIAQLGPVLLVFLLGFIGAATHAAFGPVVAAIPMGVALILNVAAVINGFALIGLTQKIDVIDHTTEPAPDAIGDLEAAYLADEIDEEELGERAAEVWANE